MAWHRTFRSHQLGKTRRPGHPLRLGRSPLHPYRHRENDLPVRREPARDKTRTENDSTVPTGLPADSRMPAMQDGGLTARQLLPSLRATVTLTLSFSAGCEAEGCISRDCTESSLLFAQKSIQQFGPMEPAHQA